jgi:hypothetical protein
MTLPINPFHFKNQPDRAIVKPAKASRLFSPLIPEGGALGIYGERGMGKSLLLNYIANPPTEWRENCFDNFIFIFLNCQDLILPPIASQFWLEVTKQLDRKLEFSPIKEKCQAVLARIADETELDHNDFHEILDVAGGARQRIVLVLDDFDCLIRTDSENLNKTRLFLQGFRSLTTRDSNKANIVVSTRYSLQELCKPLSLPNYSAFENGFTNYRLRCFDEKELLLFLQQVEQTEQPPFSSIEKRFIAYLSGFHPHLVQILAAEIFDRRIEADAPLSNLTLVEEQFKSEASPVFERLWSGASEIERVLLMLITLQKYQGKLPNAQYDLSNLPEIFSQRERELNELAERGLLNRTPPDFSDWNIFSPTFQWWILKEIESSDPTQLNERRKIWANLVTQKRADQLQEILEFLKKHREAIESVGRKLFQLAGQDLPKLPGSQ